MEAAFQTMHSILNESNSDGIGSGSVYLKLYEGIANCKLNQEKGSAELFEWALSTKSLPSYQKTMFTTWDFGLVPLLFKFQSNTQHVCAEAAASALVLLGR